MKKRDFETYQKRFWDFEILPKFSETPRFSRYHSPPLHLFSKSKPYSTTSHEHVTEDS